MWRWAIALGALATAISPPTVAGLDTVEARSENFHVVSAVGAEAATGAAVWLEQTRLRYLDLGLTLREPGPVTAIIAPTIVRVAPYARDSNLRTRGLALAAPDRNYILIAWEAPGDPLVALAHEYAHLVDPKPGNPAWFREGLADYLSLLRPGPDGVLEPFTPASRLPLLRDGEWVPHDRFLAARRGSADFAQPLYYSQAWLAVRWLAASEPDVRRLEPGPVEALGVDEAATTLRGFLATLRGAPEAIPLPTAPEATVRVLAPQALDYWLADLDRYVDPDRSRLVLERLAAEQPNWLQPKASLGALAIAEGRYNEAEELLELAVRDPEATAETHHRYSLTLLRPVDDDPVFRAEKAAIHAESALAEDPLDGRFGLTYAQALMVAGRWDDSARALRPLLSQAEWRERAVREFEELERRRTQAMRRVVAPEPDVAEPKPLDELFATKLELRVPPPPKVVQQPAQTWPPPGTTIAVGNIERVDCSGPDKLIILRHPLLKVQFREPKGRPAKLLFPPEKSWKEIPCGAKGWSINLAHRPSPRKDVLGDVVAILF